MLRLNPISTAPFAPLFARSGLHAGLAALVALVAPLPIPGRLALAAAAFGASWLVADLVETARDTAALSHWLNAPDRGRAFWRAPHRWWPAS